jgi:UDP-2,3-diacylglucosamine pyrophosphatase LpxH
MRVAAPQDTSSADPESQTVTYRSLFISDLHLGTRAAQAESFLDFLKYHDAETIYLVGDIIDFWRVKRGPVWHQSHNDVLQKLLRKARKGTRVVYIPGNHDEAMRDYCGFAFGGIEIHHDIVHTAADGRRYLVMHGDEFDVVVRYAKWLAFLGDRSYEFALWCNHPLNWVRRRLGFGFWSLSSYLKLRVKSAVNFIGEFEHALAEEARRRNVNGVICGHIHHAADRPLVGVRYLNCGDWVESCTALAEDDSGQIHLIRWQNLVRARKPAGAAQPGDAPIPAIASVPAPSMKEAAEILLDPDTELGQGLLRAKRQQALNAPAGPSRRSWMHEAAGEGRVD